MPTPYQLDIFKYLKNHFDLAVVYFTSREKDRVWELDDSPDGYKVIYLKNNVIAKTVQRVITSFHFSNQLKEVAKSLSPDFAIINGTYWSPNVQIALNISKNAGIKTAFWGEPVFASNSKAAKKIKSYFLSRVFKRVDLILAIGKQAVESYRSFGYNGQIVNIPYSIDHKPFLAGNLSDATLRELKQTFKPNGETLFLSSGSLIPRKAMDVLIKAFLASKASSTSRLIIIGEGSEREALTAIIGDSDRVKLLGFQDKSKIPYLFKMSDVFVFASRYDGWGLVINEAMTASNAIITTKSVGAANDLLVDGESAIFCDIDAPAQFTRAMDELHADKARRVALGNQAGMKAETITSEKMAQSIYGIYAMGK